MTGPRPHSQLWLLLRLGAWFKVGPERWAAARLARPEGSPGENVITCFKCERKP